MLAHMNDSTEGEAPGPRRFRRLTFDPLRHVMPWVAVVVGLFLVVRAALGRSPGDDAPWLVMGLALVVVGIAVFVVDRRRARRGR
jgi:uncharacterized membrane protein